MKILILGRGFIGQRCWDYWHMLKNVEIAITDAYIGSVEDVLGLIAYHAPDAILNAMGVVGKPNVDWCENHQLETYYGNTHLPMIIADACQQQGVYLLHIGTGCIFYGYKDGGWLPEDIANPSAVYTKSKYATDLILSTLPNVGIARIRMPIDHLLHPANLITKLATYKKVINVENSVTVIEDMQMAFLKLIENKAQGIYHVVNPGSISHKEMLERYKVYIDSKHTNEWITVDELTKLGLAQKIRSNNILNSDSLRIFEIGMRPAVVAVADAIQRYAKELKK